MSKPRVIRAAILRKLDEMRERGTVLDLQWITHAVCQDYEAGLPQGDAGDFYREAAYRATREEARRVMNAAGDRSAADEIDTQATLPGFEHMHFYYPIIRDGREVAVHVYDMTDSELDAKAEELRAMGRGCFEHADEIVRFKAKRHSAAAQ